MANIGSWQPDRLDTIHYIHKLAEERVGEGYSVISGCDVNEKGTPDMDVVVDSGSVYFNNVITAVAGNNVTISAADGTHDRIDVIYVDTSGVAQVHTGDALVKSDPLGNTVWTQYEQPYPKTGCPSGTIIALVYVPANDTAIGNVQIEDVAQYNIRKHAIDSTVEHDGVSGATENNFVSFDGNGLPKDSGHKDADYEDAGTAASTVGTHESNYTHSLIADHDTRHVTGGDDEIDGDKLDIDWNPTNYTPATTPSEADNADNLTAHLYGIDQELGSLAGNYRLADIPAGGWHVPDTNGAELETDTGTNGNMQRYLFDDSTEEFLEYVLKMPPDLNTSGTITFEVYGYASTAAASKYIQLKIYHSAKANGESWDVAYSSDTSGDKAISGSQDYLNNTTWTETISNLGWAANDQVRIKLSRIDTSAETDLTGDYGVTHVRIKIPVVV